MRCPSIIIAGLIYGGKVANAFYLPGVAPQSFSYGDEVKLKVNSLSSHQEMFTLDYYRFPFCQPEGGPTKDNENLGEFLVGDRIESSAYVLYMKEEMYCRHLCVSDLGDSEENTKAYRKSFYKAMKTKDKKKLQELKKKGIHQKPQFNLIAQAIRRGYNHNWIVDNLSAASKSEDDTTITTRYYRGFPVGYIGSDDKPYVYNHANIEIMYHPVETETGKYRVVRFTVEPFSIKHTFQETKVDEEDQYEITNPIDSCKPGSTLHTDYDLVHDRNDPQPAEGEVLFTYDVNWIENLDLHWASRWDIYLNMDNAIPANIHWSSISNAIVTAIILSTFLALVLVKNLRRDIARYNQVASDEEKADELEDIGWKLVHADVFRPPSFSPMLLSVAAGTGAQLLCMSSLTIFFSALGFINPSFRGALLMALILFYALMGVVSGYTTARIYKTLKGKKYQLATTLAATLYPGIAFGVFFILDLVAWNHHSTDAVPFSTMFVLVLLWFGISTPLVFLGAYFGYKQEPIGFPVTTSTIPRQIPSQPWYYNPYFCAFWGALLPYGSASVEMYFIMSSLWMGQYYYVFGVLAVVFSLLILLCAEMTILVAYFHLCSEDYRWWWRSFYTSGSVALLFFMQAIHYFNTLESNSFSTYLLYFGYMSVICVGLFLMTGSVGFFSTLWFNKTIYGAIKVD